MVPPTSTIDSTAFTSEAVDFIPWSADFQPTHIQSSLLAPTPQKPQVTALVVPSLAQHADRIWVYSNGRGIDFTTHTVHAYPTLETLPFDADFIFVQIPGDLSGPIQVVRQDAQGAVRWHTPLPLIASNKAFATISSDQDQVYVQTRDTGSAQTAVWRIDPATGMAAPVLELARLERIWIMDGQAYFGAQAGGKRVIQVRDLRSGAETQLAQLPDVNYGQFALVTPLPSGGLVLSSRDEILISDAEGAVQARYTSAELTPAALKDQPLKLDLSRVYLQPDGALLYVAASADGVHLLRLASN